MRGIRVDLAAAERARDLLLRKRDAVFAEASEKLECRVGMDEIGRRLPQLIAKAGKYNNAATKFLQNYILDHAVNGRIQLGLRERISSAVMWPMTEING